MHNTLFTLAISTSLFISCAMANSAQDAQPPHVILFIGDGMDEQQITMARNYLAGPSGVLRVDQMPHRSSVQVLSVAEDDPQRPLYVAESAGSGTALATGHITSRARISTSAQTDQPLKTILELAQTQGLATGVVTTASVTDATPAVFMSHINLRVCENPDMMVTDDFDCSQYLQANGGPGSIAEQIADSEVDLVLGGGLEHFLFAAEQQPLSILDVASKQGFEVLQSAAELDGYAKESVEAPRVLGLFAPEHLPVALQGSDGRTAEAPGPSLLNRIHWALGDVDLPEPMTCEPNPEFKDTPTLAAMTEFAINHLQRRAPQDTPRGFVLIVESASIDKKAHARDACGSIGEMKQLEQSLAVAQAFAKTSNTLILVTADHSQAAQIVPDESLFNAFGIPVYTPGKLVRLEMPSGGIMAINYATNDFFAEEHTGAAVPLFVNRPDLDLPSYLHQSEIFNIMRRFLDL